MLYICYLLSEYINTTKGLIDKISNISEKSTGELKPLLLKLADHIASGLKERRPEAINQSKLAIGNSRRYSTEPERILHVSKIICYFRDKYFPMMSKTWIVNNLPDEYKEPRVEFKEREQSFDIESIPESVLIDKGQDIIRRYKKLTNHGPTEPFRMKKNQADIKKHDFIMNVSSILADIIENLENDARLIIENKDKDKEAYERLMLIDKEISARLKTVSDKRHATDIAKYEAIILSCSTYDSLNNSTKYETEILNRWELFDREKGCRKCYNQLNQCRAEKCGCACHESVKRLTTKGLKWAINHNPHLEKLDKHINRLSEWSDDICSFGKILLQNPHIGDYMNKTDRRNILADHITKDKCEKCEFFLEDHPNFFDELEK